MARAIDLLLVIKKFNEDYFNKIIDLPLFKREKLYFDHIGYRWVPVQELDKYIEALSLC